MYIDCYFSCALCVQVWIQQLWFGRGTYEAEGQRRNTAGAE